MGRSKRSVLSDDEIIARYRDGESISLVALRAKVPDYHVTAVLVAAHVRLRGRCEALRLALKDREQRGSTRRMRARTGQV